MMLDHCAFALFSPEVERGGPGREFDRMLEGAVDVLRFRVPLFVRDGGDGGGHPRSMCRSILLICTSAVHIGHDV